jgi:hypothetical protein
VNISKQAVLHPSAAMAFFRQITTIAKRVSPSAAMTQCRQQPLAFRAHQLARFSAAPSHMDLIKQVC